MELSSIQLQSLKANDPQETAGERRRDLGFGLLLKNAAQDANTKQLEAERQTREIVAGRGDTLEGILAITKAETSLRFLLTLRNRGLEAFQEIMRTQV